MRTTTLLSLCAAVALLGCGSNNGDTGPEPRRCVDLSVEDCGLRSDCAIASGVAHVRTPDDAWCLVFDDLPEPVACYEPGSGVGPGVTVQAGPVDDPERCYEFYHPVELGDRWRRCEGPFRFQPSCP